MRVKMHAIARGRVQGVGFRWTVREFAREIGVEATATNLADGTVEIYAQGTKEQLDELISKLKGHFGPNYIQSFDVNILN